MNMIQKQLLVILCHVANTKNGAVKSFCVCILLRSALACEHLNTFKHPKRTM